MKTFEATLIETTNVFADDVCGKKQNKKPPRSILLKELGQLVAESVLFWAVL